MHLEYRLSEDDFLQYQLYYLYHSGTLKGHLLRSRIIISILFGLLFYTYYMHDNTYYAYIFLFAAIALLILLPYILNGVHKKTSLGQVREIYKYRFGKELNVWFNKDNFVIVDEATKTETNYTALEKVVELSSHYFVKVKSRNTLIIPKSELENLDELKKTLQRISKQSKIEYATELEWKW